MGKTSGFWKRTLIYPKWLHNDSKRVFKWPKVTSLYPKQPQNRYFSLRCSQHWRTQARLDPSKKFKKPVLFQHFRFSAVNGPSLGPLWTFLGSSWGFLGCLIPPPCDASLRRGRKWHQEPTFYLTPRDENYVVEKLKVSAFKRCNSTLLGVKYKIHSCPALKSSGPKTKTKKMKSS